MTTLHPPAAPTPVEKETDPFSNKAIAAAGTAATGFFVQWVTTGGIQFDEEGVTAIVGGIATLLVYFVSNHKRKGL